MERSAPRQPPAPCGRCGHDTDSRACERCSPPNWYGFEPAPRQPLICANVGHEHCEDCQGMDADCEDYLPQQPREGGGDRE